MKNWIAACVLLFAATGLVAQQSNAGGSGGGGGAVTQSGTWNVQIQDASANGITSNSTTFTAKRGLDINLLGTAGTAFTTPGFVDIKGADGNIFVRQAIGSNLHMVCDSGCASGGASTPADTFSNPTTAGLSIGFGAVWNGTTWDRQYGDKTNGAFVNIKNSITIPVSGTFWQATQPVSIASMPSTPVTGTFWQATQPVSGTVTVTQATGTNLHTVVDSAPTTAVTGTFNPSNVVATGNITSTQAISVNTSGMQTVTMNITGTWTGTIQPQVSVDGTNFVNVGVIPFAPAAASANTITANGQWWVVIGGANKFQLLGASVGSGTAVVTLNGSPAGFGQLAVQSQAANLNATVVQAAGSNLHVVADTGSTTAVTQATGTNLHAVIDSGSTTAVTGNVTAVQATGSNLHVAVDSVPTTAVTVADGSDTTLGAKADAKSTATDTTAISLMSVMKEISALEQAPVSRAVTNAGTFAVQAAESGTWNVTVNAALPAGTNVIGHVINDSGSTTAVTGNVTVAQATGTNLHAVLDTTSTTAVTQATGTNLHAVLDTTSTTAVTQATSSNLNADVNLKSYGGSTAASSGVSGLIPVGGYSTQNTADAAWTSATSLNTRVTLVNNIATYNSILVTLVQGTTITGGVVTLQQSNDNTNWIGVQCVNVGTTAIMGPTYTLVASTNVMFACPLNAPYFGVLLSTAITGTGTVTVGHNAQTLPNVALLAGNETLAAGTNVIGHVIADSGSTTAVTGTVSSNTAQVNGSTVVTAATGVQKVGITGNANATLDAATNGAIPTNQLWTVPTPTTAAGAALSATSLATSTTTTGTNIKGSAGNLYGVYAINGVASVCWLQFMNSATGGTLGTASIVSFPLPASTTQPIWIPLQYPIAFSTGIAIGTSTLVNGSVACGTATSVMVQYK